MGINNRKLFLSQEQKKAEEFSKTKKKYTHKFPTNFLTFSVREDRKEMKDKRNKSHPTQKPVSLCKHILETYTNEGDLVLDTRLGSASAAIACMRMKRKFIGFEKNETYYKDATKRILKEVL